MTKEVRITSVNGAECREGPDYVAVEEPLEIRIVDPTGMERSVSITMRTPGDDFELAVGFLWGEGVLVDLGHLERDHRDTSSDPNVVSVSFSGNPQNLHTLERSSYTTSSCGVCGKSSLDNLKQTSQFQIGLSRVDCNVLLELPAAARHAQETFEQTGGLHAAALFELDGNLIGLREDIGRHNAVDKLIGSQVLSRRVPLSDTVLFLSGRASFELLQKAHMAGIPIVASVGAPSSLAVQTAQEAGITLIGFLRDGRFNIYCGRERVNLKRRKVGDSVR